MTMLRAGGLLDVLTSLSACRQETVEKIMERRISGGSYMCWMDFHDLLWVSMCSINFTSVWSLFSRLPRRGLPRPIFPHGLSRPYHHCTAITPVYISRLSRHSIFLLLGYHTRAITLHHTRKSGYHTCHSS